MGRTERRAGYGYTRYVHEGSSAVEEDRRGGYRTQYVR